MNALTKTTVALGLLTSAHACYGMTTGTINVTANVAANCTVTQTQDIPFGAYTGVLIQQQFVNRVTLVCTPGSTYYTQLDFGNNSTGGTNRRMTAGGGNFITYQIYSDAGYSQVWGETLNTDTNPVNAAVAAAGPINQDAYGEIVAGQTPAVGNYADQLTATVQFF